MDTLRIRDVPDGVVFKVRVQPRASGNGIAGLIDGVIKLRLTAPPVDGKANEACRAFFAELLSIPRTRVEILSGSIGRNKTLKVTGVSAENLCAALNQK